MKPRVPRFTIRWLMLLVLLVGAALLVNDRHRRFRALADDHLQRSRFTWWMDRPDGPGIVSDSNGRPIADGDRDRFLLKANWHEAMFQYYDRAARHPYLPLGAEPDPEVYGAGFADWDFRL